jgi:hypothetical protein
MTKEVAAFIGAAYHNGVLQDTIGVHPREVAREREIVTNYVLHEFGHAVGQEHGQDPSIMSPSPWVHILDLYLSPAEKEVLANCLNVSWSICQ